MLVYNTGKAPSGYPDEVGIWELELDGHPSRMSEGTLGIHEVNMHTAWIYGVTRASTSLGVLEV